MAITSIWQRDIRYYKAFLRELIKVARSGGLKNARAEIADAAPAPVRRPQQETWKHRGQIMTIQQNTDRIQTTHIGSLPRPVALLDTMKAKFSGQPYDELRMRYRCATRCATSSETGRLRHRHRHRRRILKPGFFTYIQERLEGFEPRPNQKLILFQKEIEAFPDYYADYFKQAMLGGAIVKLNPVVCVGPVKYRGDKAVQRDIANVKAAAKAAGVPDEHVFLPATAPSGVGINEYYKSDEEYFHALASNGQGIQGVPTPESWCRWTIRSCSTFRRAGPTQQMKRRAAIYAGLQHGAQGHSAEQVRFHTCYGINEVPACTKPRCRTSSTTCSRSMRILQLRRRKSASEHEYYPFEGEGAEGQGVVPRRHHPRQ